MRRGTDWGRRLGTNLGRGVRRTVAARALPRHRSVWVVVRIHSAMGEGPPPLVVREPKLGLLEALEVLDSVADDPRVDGVVLRFVGTPAGWSKVHSLRRAVARIGAAGKPVAAYAETLDAPSFLIASAASRIWLPEAGSLFLVGLRAESYFFRGLLENLGVRPEVVRAGDYKSAAERFTRDRMSPEGREQIEAMVDDLFSELVDGIADGRGMNAEQVRALIDRGPFRARAAAEAGLIDGCLYPDEIDAKLVEMVDEASETRDRAPDPATGSKGDPADRIHLVDAVSYRNVRVAARAYVPMRTSLPRIAYVVASGMIGRGSEGRGITSGSMSKLLERLREREDVRGVLLRIDSPGGDAIASDLLWRSVLRVSEEKPVVASMGDMAASGGYFLASAAHHIFAEAGTVTGSIGVIGGKVNLEGLYERLGVTKDSVERGARAGLLSDDREFAPDERAAVRDEIADIYDIFIDRVARSRGLSREAVDHVARGRVWSGSAARRHGLVDTIGGPLDALRVLCTRAGLDSADPIALVRYPRASAFGQLAPALRWPRRLGLTGKLNSWHGIDG